MLLAQFLHWFFMDLLWSLGSDEFGTAQCV